MQFFTIIASGVAIMAATILGSALPHGVTIGLDKKGVITSTMGFSGTIHGVQLSANGTAQQIWAELEKVNPLAAAAAMASAKKRYAAKKLQTRNKVSHWHCYLPWTEF